MLFCRFEIIISLIVSVVFAGSCRSLGLWDRLFGPIEILSAAKTTLCNMNIPFMDPKIKRANSDFEFKVLLSNSYKKIVVLVFRKEFDSRTGKGGLASFNDKFLNKIAKDHLDADVLIVDTAKCQKTAANYGLPDTSDKVHFAVNFRLSENDYIDLHITDIVQELLKELNTGSKELTRDQVQASIDAMKAEVASKHLHVPIEVEKSLENVLPIEPDICVREKTIFIQVNSDEELDHNLANKSQEFIILFFTDNSLDVSDSDAKMFFGMLMGVRTGLKIIQVNVNTGNCDSAKSDYHIDGLPSVLFLKRGKMYVSRVIGFDLDAVEAEISVLLSDVELIDSDTEFTSTLSNRDNELIVYNFTDNSLNSSDLKMKTYLSAVSISPGDVKVIQMNANTERMPVSLAENHIHSFPTLLFNKRSKILSAQVNGYDGRAIDAEMSVLLSSSVIANTDVELAEALRNAKEELIVILVTDNSLTDCDCELKEYLSKLTFTVEQVKVIQVNANTRKCPRTILDFGVTSFPSVLFLKRGKVQAARVTSDKCKAIDEEVSNLLAWSVVVNNDRELDKALLNAEDERIILFFTYNILDDCELVMKKYLSCLSRIVSDIKIIQVNADTQQFPDTYAYINVEWYPSLSFIKFGVNHGDMIIGYDEKAILAAISKLLE